ncbi:MAG TPA: redox-sensing transcriptional repressor Rex [Feifaniaceae bacterium]|nr:redox-sensing transcriptional repressor Rex [Feifaniaceae bacterium]
MAISVQALQRLPVYLNYLKSLPREGALNISSTSIAEGLGLNDVQVRKDLALVSGGGRPKVGYILRDLIFDIEQFLGYGDSNSAVLVGAGNLGRALLSYGGFSEYGLDIVAAFDTDDSLIGSAVNGKPILSADKLGDLCSRMKIRLGIITVPEHEAQAVCDRLVESGVLAVLNFAHVRLKTPGHVLVQNENLACSLAVLSKHLSEQLLELE